LTLLSSHYYLQPVAGAQFSSVQFPPVVDDKPQPDWPLALVAQCTVLKHFRELLEQREEVLANEDVEAVHRIRVAARRCRTALQTFTELWPGDEARRHLKQLSDFAGSFNEARDLDVMIIYLRKQLESADEQHRGALEWLLKRNIALREKQQPLLVQALEKFEAKHTARKFADFYSRRPLNLWPHSEAADG
jgi:CHAD domain-containing protein